jgi:hypothetical protein
MAATIVSFVFGGVWYSAFSKQWMDAVGMQPDRMPKERGQIGSLRAGLRSPSW